LALLEDLPTADSGFMSHTSPEPKKIQCAEQPTAVLRELVPMTSLTEFFSRAFDAVAGEVQKQNVRLAGPPFALYRGTPAETVDVEAGFPILGTFEGAGTVVRGTLPECEAYEAVHTGPYDTLEITYRAVQEQMKAAGKTPSETMWEYYLNGPPDEPDPRNWQTRIVWPVA
jgi:effector-binding domain-containing protein